MARKDVEFLSSHHRITRLLQSLRIVILWSNRHHEINKNEERTEITTQPSKKDVTTEYSTLKSKIALFTQVYPEQAWEENGRIFMKKITKP